MPTMGILPERALALETLDLCAGLRTGTWDLIHSVQDAVFDSAGRLVDRLPAPPIILLAAIFEAVRPARPHSTKVYNPCATLSPEEYRQRYELGRQRYLQERAVRKFRRKAWCRENGPWLLLAAIGALLITLLGVAQPHQIVVLMALALYTGLAWLVCWVVRASD
jgi:hypothetical protein